MSARDQWEEWHHKIGGDPDVAVLVDVETEYRRDVKRGKPAGTCTHIG